MPMTPIYFGRSESALYGVYHAPTGIDRREGIVFCYPFGQEYMRSHRAYRQMASQLTQLGFHVLRFDFRGTGDSSGDMDGVRAEDWLQDTEDAVRELRDIAGLASASVMGLRVGALFAATACSRRDDIDRLILWDPVVSGSQYEAESMAEIVRASGEYLIPLGNTTLPGGGFHLNGFSVPGGFLESMRSLDLTEMIPVRTNRIFHIVSRETATFEQLRESWSAHSGYEYRCEYAPHDWNYVDNVGGILVPQPVMKAIVGWMSDGSDR